MKDEYVVNGAICLCKFGTAPGFLKVLNDQAVCMNGKLAATDKTLGNVFEGTGFTMCKKSWPPRPCTPSIVNWSGAYDGVSINGSSSPLLGTSKGTCAMGCTDCISFQTSGQIPIPNEQQVMKSAMALRNDINPLAMDEPSIVTYHVYWNGRIEKHIPKVIQKGYENKYKYVYHDEKGQEHEIGLFNYFTTTAMAPKNIPIKGRNVELIDVRDFKGYCSPNVKIRFSTINSPSSRYYINPSCLASLFGAMAILNIDYLGFNGFSDKLARSVGKSRSHINGERGDLRYLSNNRNGEAILLQSSSFDYKM